MACDLNPACNFIFGFLWCTLPLDTIDVEFIIRTIKGIHMLWKDQTTETATCSHWSRQIKPFPSLQKKMEVYEDERKDGNSPFCPNPIQFTKKNPSTRRSRERSSGRRKQRKLDMGHFTPPKVKRPANFGPHCQPQKSTTTTTTMTMAAKPRIAITTHMMPSSCMMCKRWGPSCPFCAQAAPHPSPIESNWPNEDRNGDKQRAKEEKREEEQQDQEKNDEKKVANDYHPTSPVYDPKFKQDPLPHYSPKEKLALDPNYYPPNYVPDEEVTPLFL